MNLTASSPLSLEKLLGSLLHYGTWLASIVIGAGLALALIDSRFGTHNLAIIPNMRIATAGVVLFVLLPTLRVLLMFAVYVWERDYRLAITAALVLTIVILGYVAGVHTMDGKRAVPPNGELHHAER